MARLVTRRAGGRWRVAVAGRLSAADLRRLESACAPALASRPLPLDLQLDAVSDVDGPARAFIKHLLQQGATLIGATAAHWPERFGRGGDPRP